MEKINAANLFVAANKNIRNEFEFIRQTNPHSGEKGKESEKILIKFLNTHLPKRFTATSGILIDSSSQISKQTDVIIYDSFSSPVYRASEDAQIIPADSVATVIEVKSVLNKSNLDDAFSKIASCKALNKRNVEDIDKNIIGAELKNISTQGIIFAFTSQTSLETLAQNVFDIQQKFESSLWPDLIVVLDKGYISYFAKSPFDNLDPANFLLPFKDKFCPPPLDITQGLSNDKDYAFNNFFNLIIIHLTFYPMRPSHLPFEIIEGMSTEHVSYFKYRYDTKRRLYPIHQDSRSSVSFKYRLEIYKKIGKARKKLSEIQYCPWLDGCILIYYGNELLKEVLSELISEKFEVFTSYNPPRQISSVLKLPEDEFTKWPSKFMNIKWSIKAMYGMTIETRLISPGEKDKKV